MYGLLIENMSEYIKHTYGEEKWEDIRRAAAVDQPSFSTHQVYPEALLPRLAKKAVQVNVTVISIIYQAKLSEKVRNKFFIKKKCN